jgi:antitoxin component YwqK of YwqJK toxin-antitoxin module
MKIIITEEQKKKLFIPITESEESKKGKLFIPRRLSGENSRFIQWNKEQPIVDGVQINQYTHDGKKESIWEEYYENGQLESKGLYKDNIKTGIWEDYYTNGQLAGKGQFKNGKQDGIWEEYYENGKLSSKGLYKDGKYDGIWEYYYPNGQLSSKGLYKNGLRDGICEYYDENGQLLYKGSFKNDKLIKELPITESEQSKKGKLFIPRRLSGENSRFIQWNKEQPIVDGERINQYTHDGKKTGIWEYYWDNGQLHSKGLFKNGKRDGIWESYHENGQLFSKGSYENDIKEGYWEFYWNNGQLWSKGLYKDGKKDGIWEEYHRNGQLISKGLFKDGKYVKKLPITESEESKKGKLFIPRRIDQRKIEAEELKQKYISEIKEIIEEEGIISMGELGGNSIVYGYSPEDEENEVALIEQFYSDHVEVVVYGGYKYNTEETSFPVKYEELKLKQLVEIRELLETYESHSAW